MNSYKLVLGQTSQISLEGVYGREDALEVVNAATSDYNEEFGI